MAAKPEVGAKVSAEEPVVVLNSRHTILRRLSQRNSITNSHSSRWLRNSENLTISSAAPEWTRLVVQA